VTRYYAELFLIIIVLMMFEGLVLGALWRLRRQGVRPGPLVVNLLAGIGLLMAALAVVLGAAAPWLAICLFFALVMHLADLRMRWVR